MDLGRDASAVRVASANAASGRDERGRPAFPAWAGDAARLGVDVLAVQEVDHLLERSGRADQTAELAAACSADGPPWSARFAAAVHDAPGTAGVRPAERTAADVPSYGVALLSRHPVADWRELRMAASRAVLPVLVPGGVVRAADEPRVALAGVVGSPAGDLTVVTTHLSFAPHRAVGQLRQLVAWARDLPRPLVLLGDLNLPGRVPSLLTGWTPLVRAPTYPRGRPRVQLDHVLLDAGGGAARGEPVGTAVVGGSDHLAAVAAVHVRG